MCSPQRLAAACCPRPAILVLCLFILSGPFVPAAAAAGGGARWKLAAQLAGSGDEAEWALPAHAGSVLSVKLKTTGDLVPELELVGPTGGEPTSVSLNAGGSAKTLQASGVELTEQGVHTLVLRAVSGSGQATLAVSIRAPQQVVAPPANGNQVSPGQFEIALELLSGEALSLTADLETLGIADPGSVTFDGPFGPLDASPYSKTQGGKLRVKKLPVGFTGTLVVGLPVDSVPNGSIKLKISPAKSPGAAIDPDLLPAVVQAAAAFLKGGASKNAAAYLLAQAVAGAMDSSASALDGYERAAASALAALGKHGKLATWSKAAGAVSQPPMADATPIGAGSGEACRFTVIYVNGVLTPAAVVPATEALLRPLVRAAAPTGSEVRLTHWYNPSGLQTEDGSPCATLVLVSAAMLLDTVPFASGVLDVYRRIGNTACGVADFASGVAIDLAYESSQQFIDQYLGIGAESAKAGKLAERIRAQLKHDRLVIVVAHSQGNFYAETALGLLSPQERSRVAVLALASPGSFNDATSGSVTYGGFRHVTLEHDIISNVPTSLPENQENSVSAAFPSICPSVLAAPLCFAHGVAIHDIARSYLGASASRAAVFNALHDLFAQLAADHCDLLPPTEHLGPYDLTVTPVFQAGKWRAELRWKIDDPEGQVVVFQRNWLKNGNWVAPTTSNDIPQGVTVKLDLPQAAETAKNTFRYRIMTKAPGVPFEHKFTEWVEVTLDNSP